jgi:hypothetical protein
VHASRGCSLLAASLKICALPAQQDRMAPFLLLFGSGRCLMTQPVPPMHQRFAADRRPFLVFTADS